MFAFLALVRTTGRTEAKFGGLLLTSKALPSRYRLFKSWASATTTRAAVSGHASRGNIDIRYPVRAPSSRSAGFPSIASDRDQIEFAYSKATPFTTERQAAAATATVLEGCDNRRARLVFADCSGTKDPDIAVIPCACALTIDDGLANDLISQRRIPFRSFEDTLCSLCAGHNFNRRMETFFEDSGDVRACAESSN